MANARDTRVAAHLEQWPAGLVVLAQEYQQLVSIGPHRAELQHLEAAAMFSHSLLAIEHRPGRVELDGKRDAKEQR